MRISVRAKIEAWVSEKPDGYLSKTLEQMAEEVGVSKVSIWRYLPEIIAERDGCLPSEVIAKRVSAGFYRGMGHKLNQDEIEKIKKYANKGIPVRDIAYLLKRCPETIKKYLLL